MNNKKNKEICHLCSSENNNLTSINDNYIRIDSVFVPFKEIVKNTLQIELSSEEKSQPVMEICKRCEKKVFDFYNFKKKCKTIQKENRPFLRNPDVRQQKINDKLVYSTVQLIQEFKNKHGGIKEIKELQNQLIISSVKIDETIQPTPFEVSSTTSTFQIDLSIKQEPIIEIKEEPSELKLELKEEDEADASDILGLLSHEEDVSNSSDSSLSRLPAFCANRFFDGNRFVSRSELLESKLKNSQRKRERRPEFWAAAIQKKLRNHGQQYRSVKGNVVAARKLGMPCNCRKNCGAKISENNRVANFKQYWEIENHVEKKKFLIDHIKLLKPKRALTKNRIFSRIMHHFLDVVNYDGSTEKIRVCKKMFISTFNISNSVISNAFKILSKDHELFYEH